MKYSPICMLSLLPLVVSVYSPSSLQSGPDVSGSTFPASVLYSSADHMITIVGSTFGRFFDGHSQLSIPKETSSCFIATIAMPTEAERFMKYKTLKSFGTDDASEACGNAIFHSRSEKLIVTGHSERHGFMDDLYDASQLQQATQYGLLLDIDIDNMQWKENFHLLGGRVLQDSRVTYPISLYSGATDEWIYVASQVTDNPVRNDQDETDEFNVSEETDPARFFKWGSNYKLKLGRYRVSSTPHDNGIHETISEGWTELMATENNDSVHVSDMVEIGGILVIVGTTDGTGTDFGAGEPTASLANLDGFIMKRDIETGKAVPASSGERSSHRIQSLDDEDDWIAGICHDGDNDPDHFYVVGATSGNLESVGESNPDQIDAFVMKINVKTLDTVWTTQIAAEGVEDPKARGVTCVVDGDSIWIGGVVQDSAMLPNSGVTQSYGKDDLFVGKLKTEDGSQVFLRQIGSIEDDGLAMRGGITIDNEGNCIIVGTTYGSFYRRRDPDTELNDQPWISDMVVTMVSGNNGEIAFPVAHTEFKEGTHNVPHPGMPNSDPNPHGGSPPHSGSQPNENPKDVVLPKDNDGDLEPTPVSAGFTNGMKFMIMAMVASVLILFLFVRSRPKLNTDVTTNRSEVIQYLNAFDVEDIDLKHSATGGWHCSYANGLAKGVNRQLTRSSYNSQSLHDPTRDDPLLTAPLNDDSMRDSLFADSSDRFSESKSSQRQGYEGLIDSYNADWEGKRNDTNPWGKDIV